MHQEEIMRKEDLVKRSLRYMEDHLDENLSVEIIARHGGYSVSRFSRIFRESMGMPVMEYVKRRRLIRASQEILEGQRIIHAAMNWGYGSRSGFTKAFCQEFGFSPVLLKAMRMHLEEGGSGMDHVFMGQEEVPMTKEELLGRLKEVVRENQIQLEEKEIQAVYAETVRAYEGKMRYSGDEYVTHPLWVSVILAHMEAEPCCILAGMMCDVLKKTDTDPEALKLPEEVRRLVIKVNQAEKEKLAGQERDVLLVILAERLHNMRTIEHMDEKARKKKAEETLECFFP